MSQSFADLIRALKRDSSKWVKVDQPQLADFPWQPGYGAFSISPSHVDDLKRSIANQEQHHRQESFQDEFRRSTNTRSSTNHSGQKRE